MLRTAALPLPCQAQQPGGKDTGPVQSSAAWRAGTRHRASGVAPCMAAAPCTHLACGTSGLLLAAAPAVTESLCPCHLQGGGAELPDHSSQGPAGKRVQQELKGWGRGRSLTILHHSHLLFLCWGQTGLWHLQRPAQHAECPAVAAQHRAAIWDPARTFCKKISSKFAASSSPYLWLLFQVSFCLWPKQMQHLEKSDTPRSQKGFWTRCVLVPCPTITPLTLPAPRWGRLCPALGPLRGWLRGPTPVPAHPRDHSST